MIPLFKQAIGYLFTGLFLLCLRPAHDPPGAVAGAPEGALHGS